MAESACKSTEIGGGMDGLKNSCSEPSRQSNSTVVYRVYINEVPNEMTDRELLGIVQAATEVQPKFSKVCESRYDKNGCETYDRVRRYCIADFDSENPASILADTLHQVGPHFFDARVVRKIFDNLGPRYQRGGYRKNLNFQNRQGNQQRYGSQSYYNQNYGQNHFGRGGNFNRFPKSPQNKNAFGPGGPRPTFVVNPEMSAYPLYKSPPPAIGAPIPNLAFPADFSGQMIFPGPQPCLMLMGGEQYCFGCGAMTQSNCSTCFTPFCSPFCLGKLNNPSHPFECASMLDSSCPQEAMNAQFGVWMQPNQQQPMFEGRKGRGNNHRKNNNNSRFRSIEPSEAVIEPVESINGHTKEDDTEALEESMKKVALEKTAEPKVATPVPALVASLLPTPPTSILGAPPGVQDTAKITMKAVSPPTAETFKTPDNFACSKQATYFAGQTPRKATPPAMQILEPFRSTPPQFNKLVPPPPSSFLMPNAVNTMCGPGNSSQPMFVLIPNPMMMAPYFGEQQMQLPEQPQFDMVQSGGIGFNPQYAQPPAIYWPNYQAY